MRDIKSVLFDQEMFDSEAELDDFLKDKEDFIVQRLHFNNTVFKEKSEVIEWAKGQFFFTGDIEDTATEFVLTQFDESAFKESSLQMMEIRRGVKAQVGEWREVSQGLCLSLRSKNGKGKDIKLSENLPHVIEVAKVVKGFHPDYGEVEITEGVLDQFIKNFKDEVLGVDIRIDYDHDRREAAGWIKNIFKDISGQVLLAEVKWTPKGALSLSDGEFRYFSPTFTLNFIHPHTRQEHGPTLKGGALVNDPFLRMEPIVNMKDGKDMGNETISLSDHKTKVSELEKQISDYQLSEEKVKNVVTSLKTDNKELSEKNTKLEKAAKDAKAEGARTKLFSDGKINKAQLQALRDGKDMMDVLAMSEKMNLDPDGTNKGGGKAIELSDKEKKMCKKLDLTDEEYRKANPVEEGDE